MSVEPIARRQGSAPGQRAAPCRSRRAWNLSQLLLVVLLGMAPFMGRADSVVEDTRAIYQRIARVMQDKRAAPALHVVEGGDNGLVGARFSPSLGAIQIQMEFVDLCRNRFEARWQDAVAVCLGHELAHFYCNHTWHHAWGLSPEAEPGADSGAAAANHKLKQDNRARAEAEADYQGGFWAYVAGYDTLDIAPRVIDLLYDELGAREGPGYPARAVRREEITRAVARLRERTPLAEAATLLLLAGEFEVAGACFAALAREFPSHAVLLNAGAAHLHAALEYWPRETFPFACPVLFSEDLRLPQAIADAAPGSQDRETDSQGSMGRTPRGEELLAVAAPFLRQALEMRPDDPATLASLALALQLGGDDILAEAYAAKAAVQSVGARPATAEAVRMVHAVILAAQGNQDDARKHFAELEHIFPRLATANLHALDPSANVAPEIEDAAPSLPCAPAIGGLTLEALRARFAEPEWPGVDIHTCNVHLDNGHELRVHMARAHTWEACLVDAPASGALFLRTAGTFPAEFCGGDAPGFAIDTPGEAVVQYLGPPAYPALSAEAEFLLYPAQGVAVRLHGTPGRVAGWTLFQIDK